MYYFLICIRLMILFVIYLGEGFGKFMDICKIFEVSGLVIIL